MQFRPFMLGVSLSIGQVLADGMPIEEGRYVGGKVTELTLSPWQVTQLRAGDAQVLQLSQRQRNRLRTESGSAPHRLYIYNTRLGENDCTCCAVNRGLWFADWRIEVPHAYLNEDEIMRAPDGIIRASLVVMAVGGMVLVTFRYAWKRFNRPAKPSGTTKEGEQGGDGDA